MDWSIPPSPDRLGAFEVHLPIRLRLARREDLEALEWFGWFSAQRELIEEAYQRQRCGEVVMLVAVTDGAPIAQVWVDLTRKADEGVGILWALRVLPGLHGFGIGSRLVRCAESLLHRRGFRYSEIGAEREAMATRSLYERLGYRLHGMDREHERFTTPDGRRATREIEQWILRKPLAPHRG